MKARSTASGWEGLTDHLLQLRARARAGLGIERVPVYVVSSLAVLDDLTPAPHGPQLRAGTVAAMTARSRGALVVGIVLMVGAILGATATVYAGRYNCGSALSAHEPEGAFSSPAAQSRAEDRCNGKI